MEHIPDRGMSGQEKEAYDFFTATTILAQKGNKKILVLLTWLPHVKYIMSNPTLYALDFCTTDPHGGFY